MIYGSRRQTWRDTYARCRRLASALAQRGIGAGDTVAAMQRAGRAPAELSREFGCSSQATHNWVAQAAIDAGKPLPGKDSLSTAEREELSRLRRQVRQLQMERDILANRRRGVPRPLWMETRGSSTLVRRRAVAASFLEAVDPVANMVQGTLRTKLWWRFVRPRLGR